MTPDFFELLQKAGLKESGFVFDPRSVNAARNNYRCSKSVWVSKVGSRIGRRANIVVSSGSEKIKFASLHDLRRSFGARWASRVMPQELMKLMRHDSLDTTLRYYVGHDATRIAADIWKYG